MTPDTDRINHTLLCAGVFMIWFAISVLVGSLPFYQMLNNNGLVMSVLCLLEFAVLVPIYRGYQRRYQDIPPGKLRLRQTILFTLLLIAIIVCQSLYVQPEGWVAAQLDYTDIRLALFLVAVVILAPVFEEILFRGFILQAFMLWVPRQRIACSLLVSIIFAAMHTQYAQIQTIIALVTLSLLLCAARLYSGGLKLPIFLHMVNNLLSVGPPLWLVYTH